MRLRSLVLSVAGRLNPCAHGPLTRRKPDDYTTVSPYLRCYSNALASPSQARPSKSNPETPGDRPLGPVLDFMRLMWAINHGLDRASRGMQAKFGVTGPQRLVLRIVGTFPGLSAGDLARTLHVHPSTLTGILQRLEARRLLRRLTDPSDARRVQLEITARGKRLTVPSVGTVESAIKRLMSAWTDSELNVTRRTLTAIAEELDGSPTGSRTKRTESK